MGMCPYQQLNQQPFGAPDDPQPTKPHWVGPDFAIFKHDEEWLWSLNEDTAPPPPHLIKKTKTKGK